MTAMTVEEERGAAARTVARYARDAEDQQMLLDALGLTTSTTDPEGATPMDAYTAVARSMARDGHSYQQIADHIGLTKDEIAQLVKGDDQAPQVTAAPSLKAAPAPAAEPSTPAPSASSYAADLIAWGEAHTASRVQTLAARARTALAELAQTRDKEQAVATAEARVKRLQDQLAKAQAELRETKGSGTPAAAAQAHSYSLEERKRIREWARQNGHEVAERGIIAQHIVDAYEAATTPSLAA